MNTYEIQKDLQKALENIDKNDYTRVISPLKRWQIQKLKSNQASKKLSKKYKLIW